MRASIARNQEVAVRLSRVCSGFASEWVTGEVSELVLLCNSRRVSPGNHIMAASFPSRASFDRILFDKPLIVDSDFERIRLVLCPYCLESFRLSFSALPPRIGFCLRMSKQQ